MADKRKEHPIQSDGSLVKRVRQGEEGAASRALVSRSDRTSSLAAAVMALTEAHSVCI